MTAVPRRIVPAVRGRVARHAAGKLRRPPKVARAGLATQIFLLVVSLIWIFPIAYAILGSFRDYDYTSKNGYLSFGGFTFQNYRDASRRPTSSAHDAQLADLSPCRRS